MIGNHQGLSTRLRNDVSHLINVHCITHCKAVATCELLKCSFVTLVFHLVPI
jgi:hypothetical protein